MAKASMRPWLAMLLLLGCRTVAAGGEATAPRPDDPAQVHALAVELAHLRLPEDRWPGYVARLAAYLDSDPDSSAETRQDLEREVGYDFVVGLVISELESHFSAEELQALIAFSRTPLGEKRDREQEEMAWAVEEAGRPRLLALVRLSFFEALKQTFAERGKPLPAALAQPPPPPPPLPPAPEGETGQLAMQLARLQLSEARWTELVAAAERSQFRPAADKDPPAARALSEQIQKGLHALHALVVEFLTYESVVRPVAIELAARYSPEELRGLIAFAATPVGQKESDVAAADLREQQAAIRKRLAPVVAHRAKSPVAAVPRTECIEWRQTGRCQGRGPREPWNDRACDETILSGWSGYCECGGSTKVPVGCDHREVSCNRVCASGAWTEPTPRD